jgi:hypothetical protein
MPKTPPPADEPLPATLAFVSIMGIVFTFGWFAMFELLRARW